MAAYGWGTNRAVVDGLFEETYRFDFYQAVKLLEILFPEKSPVGEDGEPDAEAVRFRSRVDFDFPPSDVDSLRRGRPDEPVEMLVNFMGLAGGLGPLPRAVSEVVYRRAARNDTAFRDFLDIFNHRLVSLTYRARKRTRVALHSRSPEENPFARCLFALMGLGTPALRGRMAVRDRSLLAYAGLLSRRVRSTTGLVGILADYYGVGVRAEVLRPRWLPIEEDQRTRIGLSGRNHALGSGAVLGERAWEQAGGFELQLGPLSYRQFLGFLPTGEAFQSLSALTRFYAGEDLDATARLTLKAEDVPQLRIGMAADSRIGWNARLQPMRESAAGKTPGLRLGQAGGARLGWTTWLKTRPFTRNDSQVCLRIKTH